MSFLVGAAVQAIGYKKNQTINVIKARTWKKCLIAYLKNE